MQRTFTNQAAKCRIPNKNWQKDLGWHLKEEAFKMSVDTWKRIQLY